MTSDFNSEFIDVNDVAVTINSKTFVDLNVEQGNEIDDENVGRVIL